MSKPTLLSLVQDILSDADGDEVNSISDTIEADQCARVIRDTFRNIVDVHDIKYHEGLKQLDATSSSTPAQMTRPEGLHSVEWVKYDMRVSAGGDPRYQEVSYMEPERFIQTTASRTESDSTVTAMTLTSNFQVLIMNDRAPTFYTFLEGYDNFIFDAYDSDLETNLQQSKTLV